MDKDSKRLDEPLPQKKKIRTLNHFTNLVQIVTKSLRKEKKKNQLPSINFQDEPQPGKPFSAGKESDLEKLFQLVKSLPLGKILELDLQDG